MATALLFDRERVDELERWQDHLPRLRGSSILWIDLESPDDEQLDDLADELELTRDSRRRLSSASTSAQFSDFGEYVQVTAWAPSDPGDRELRRVVCLVSERWIATIHDGPVSVLDTIRERASGSGATGELDGLAFLANILEWVLESYLAAFEEIERSLEEIDAAAMRGDASSTQDEVLARLVASRREIGRLRRALTSHRDAMLSLTRPELKAIGNADSAERFSALRDRLEEAVQAARDSREAVVGSFDLLIASTGQRTNEIMKILTLASVLLLPGSLVAGLLGMNFKVGIFQHPFLFWVVLAAVVATAGTTLILARLRDWI